MGAQAGKEAEVEMLDIATTISVEAEAANRARGLLTSPSYGTTEELTMVPEKDLRRVRRSRSPIMQRLAEKLGLGRAQAETCIKPSKVGGRRFSKVELGGKEYNSPDPEECVKPSTLKRKNASDHCLDLDLHTRLAQERAERAQEREKKKLEASAASALKASAARHQKRNQRELEATSSAPAPPPKRQRSNPLPSVAPESVP